VKKGKKSGMLTFLLRFYAILPDSHIFDRHLSINPQDLTRLG
jgi:hypothetical protein